MPPGQHRHRVGADLVGHVAVGGHTVGAHHHRVHAPLLHHVAGHVVGDERHRHLLLAQLPCGEPGALEEGPGLVHEHLFDGLARLLHGAQHPQRGAVTRGGQGTGVAVGEDAPGPLQQPGAQAAEPPVGGDVFLVHVEGRLLQAALQSLQAAVPVDLIDPPHPRQRPVEVHRGGTGVLQGAEDPLHDRVEALSGLDAARPQGDPHGRGDTDGGGAPHDHGADGLGHLPIVAANPVLLPAGQPPLVDEDHLPAPPFDGSYGHVRPEPPFRSGSGPPSLRESASFGFATLRSGRTGIVVQGVRWSFEQTPI